MRSRFLPQRMFQRKPAVNPITNVLKNRSNSGIVALGPSRKLARPIHDKRRRDDRGYRE